jgi:hypothetical protein
VSLADDLAGAARLAIEHAEPGDAVSGIIAAEPRAGERVYLCALDGRDGYRSWIAVREDGAPVTSRKELREAVSIAALCEVAGEAAGGGDVDSLIASVAALRESEAPPGIEQAEQAARALRRVLA